MMIQYFPEYASVWSVCLYLDKTMHTPPHQQYIHTSLDEVVPAKYLLCPKLECIEQMQIVTVSKGELFVAVFDKAFDRAVIVIERSWIAVSLLSLMSFVRDWISAFLDAMATWICV